MKEEKEEGIKKGIYKGRLQRDDATRGIFKGGEWKHTESRGGKLQRVEGRRWEKKKGKKMVER